MREQKPGADTFRQDVQKLMLQDGVSYADKVASFGAALMSIVFSVAKTRPGTADDLAVDRALGNIITLIAVYEEMRMGKEEGTSRPQHTDA